MSALLLNSLIVLVFVLGYLAIIFEFHIRVNKTAVALLIAVVCWMLYFINDGVPLHVNLVELAHHMSDISQILFFLLGAMTLVELIDSHKGFNTVLRLVNTRSKRKVMTIISLLSFFLSAVLDNLTTTILMVSILKQLVPVRSERFLLACMVVIAANAGGAWTPIGDVTTTMLWINGQITSFQVVKSVFLPSVVCMLVPLGIYLFYLKGEYTSPVKDLEFADEEPGAKLVFFMGLLSLISVPIIKWLTGLPPFMGMLIALAVLWLITDILHQKHDHRQHLRVPFILTKIDVSSILFFLGILLAVDSLDSVGLLKEVAVFLDTTVQAPAWIATAIGLLSSIVDNVPLVAASMGMYKLSVYPVDSNFWLLVAYAAGTGGSLLVIGSSAGVALMGLDDVDFIQYAKKAFFPSLFGFFAGIAVFLYFHPF